MRLFIQSRLWIMGTWGLKALFLPIVWKSGIFHEKQLPLKKWGIIINRSNSHLFFLQKMKPPTATITMAPKIHPKTAPQMTPVKV